MPVSYHRSRGRANRRYAQIITIIGLATFGALFVLVNPIIAWLVRFGLPLVPAIVCAFLLVITPFKLASSKICP